MTERATTPEREALRAVLQENYTHTLSMDQRIDAILWAGFRLRVDAEHD